MTPNRKESQPGNPAKCERVVEESRPHPRGGKAGPEDPPEAANAWKQGLNLKMMIYIKDSCFMVLY